MRELHNISAGHNCGEGVLIKTRVKKLRPIRAAPNLIVNAEARQRDPAGPRVAPESSHGWPCLRGTFLAFWPVTDQPASSIKRRKRAVKLGNFTALTLRRMGAYPIKRWPEERALGLAQPSDRSLLACWPPGGNLVNPMGYERTGEARD